MEVQYQRTRSQRIKGVVGLSCTAELVTTGTGSCVGERANVLPITCYGTPAAMKHEQSIHRQLNARSAQCEEGWVESVCRASPEISTTVFVEASHNLLRIKSVTSVLLVMFS